MSQPEILASQVTINNKGLTGSKAITGTSAVTPATGYYFCSIYFAADTVIAAKTDKTDAINADVTAFTSFPKGSTIYGKWDSITLTSGEAIGYYAKG